MTLRISPKHLGDELTLDEYNACQMLLYRQAYTEKIRLNTQVSTQGNFAKYTYTANPHLALGKTDTLIVKPVLANSTIEPQETDTIPENERYIKLRLNALTNTKIDYYALLYYQSEDTTDDTRNELRRPEINIEKEFDTILVHATIETENNQTFLKIPLTKTILGRVHGVYKRSTQLYNQITLHASFDAKPYVDVHNGKANQMDEILVSNAQQLFQLIKYQPNDGVKRIYRLDSRYVYSFTEPLQIKYKQNVEIRGGTNIPATIECAGMHRAFIVKAQGTLTLQNLYIMDCDSLSESYYPGLGGAILVLNDETGYGILQCANCTFTNNIATHGGAIFSTYNGLYLDSCTFLDNIATAIDGVNNPKGGAIYYKSETIKLEMDDIMAKMGTNATMTCKVFNDKGQSINGGSIEWYVDGVYQRGKTSPVVNGTSTFTYTLSRTEFKQFTVTAYYKSSDGAENTSTQGVIFVQDPTVLTLSMDKELVVTPGTQLKLQATSLDQHGAVETSGTGVFTVDGQTYNATVENGKYVYTFPIPRTDYKKEYPVEFTVADMLCSVIKSTVKVRDLHTTVLFVDRTTKVTKAMTDKWKQSGVTDVFVMCNDVTDSKENSNIITASNELKKTDIRMHASIPCFVDLKTDKYVKPSAERVTWIKEQITTVKNTINVSGIFLDYFRYSGTDTGSLKPDNSRREFIKTNLQTISEHVKTTDKNYILSVGVMPKSTVIKSGDKYTSGGKSITFPNEFVGKTQNAVFYGQDYADMKLYCDRVMPLAYKDSFNGDDNWVKQVVQDAITTTSKDMVVPILQTYKGSKKTKLTKAVLDATVKVIAALDVKGVALFRYGLIDVYPDDYSKVWEALQ